MPQLADRATTDQRDQAQGSQTILTSRFFRPFWFTGERQLLAQMAAKAV